MPKLTPRSTIQFGGQGIYFDQKGECDCLIHAKFANLGEMWINKKKTTVPVCPKCNKIIGFKVKKIKLVTPTPT